MQRGAQHPLSYIAGSGIPTLQAPAPLSTWFARFRLQPAQSCSCTSDAIPATGRPWGGGGWMFRKATMQEHAAIDLT